MSSSQDESTSMNYNVKVFARGFNIGEIDDVDTGDTITFHNMTGDRLPLSFPAGFSDFASVTIEPYSPGRITVIARDGQYQLADDSIRPERSPNDVMSLKIKMGGGGGGGDHDPRGRHE